MARRNLKSCLEADFLKKLKGTILLKILTPFRSPLKEKGFQFPDVETGKIEYPVLAGILAEPGEQLVALVEAIYLIANVGIDERFDELLAASKTLKISIPDAKITAPDLAALVYLKSPQTLERLERASLYERRRKFECFVAREREKPIDAAKLPKTLAPLEDDLRERFRKLKRGRRCTITRTDGDGEIRYLIQRGDPYTRQPSCDDENSGAAVYRPERTDFVILDLVNNELRINARGIAVVEMYLEVFCAHLFGDKNRFIYARKYTLAPLKEMGRASLVCSDIEGMQSVKLVQLEYRWPGFLDHRDNTRATNVFSALAPRWKAIREAVFLMAKFKIKLTGEKTWRSVRIVPDNTAEFTHGDEGLIVEDWLRLRGFVLLGAATNEEADDAATGN